MCDVSSVDLHTGCTSQTTLFFKPTAQGKEQPLLDESNTMLALQSAALLGQQTSWSFLKPTDNYHTDTWPSCCLKKAPDTPWSDTYQYQSDSPCCHLSHRRDKLHLPHCGTWVCSPLPPAENTHTQPHFSSCVWVPCAIFWSPLLYSFQHGVWGLLVWYLRLRSPLLYSDLSWHPDREQGEGAWKEKNKGRVEPLLARVQGAAGCPSRPIARVPEHGVTMTVRGISQTRASSDWRGSISCLNASGHGKISFNTVCRPPAPFRVSNCLMIFTVAAHTPNCFLHFLRSTLLYEMLC